jgi:hypothetical protein
VQKKLDPLQAYIGLSDAELKNVVLSMPPVLHYNHDSVVQEKLEHMMCVLDLTIDQLKTEVLSNRAALGYGYNNEKWPIMVSRFADEEDDGKVVEDAVSVAVGRSVVVRCFNSSALEVQFSSVQLSPLNSPSSVASSSSPALA